MGGTALFFFVFDGAIKFKYDIKVMCVTKYVQHHKEVTEPKLDADKVNVNVTLRGYMTIEFPLFRIVL